MGAEGTHANYVADARFEFPVGTVITKSFGFPATSACRPRQYSGSRRASWSTPRMGGRLELVWNDTQRDARISPGGEILSPVFIDKQGQRQMPSYLIPSQSECKKCHANDGAMITLGPWAQQLIAITRMPVGRRTS